MDNLGRCDWYAVAVTLAHLSHHLSTLKITFFYRSWSWRTEFKRTNLRSIWTWLVRWSEIWWDDRSKILSWVQTDRCRWVWLCRNIESFKVRCTTYDTEGLRLGKKVHSLENCSRISIHRFCSFFWGGCDILSIFIFPPPVLLLLLATRHGTISTSLLYSGYMLPGCPCLFSITAECNPSRPRSSVAKYFSKMLRGDEHCRILPSISSAHICGVCHRVSFTNVWCERCDDTLTPLQQE
jgi:hypothetical protein